MHAGGRLFGSDDLVSRVEANANEFDLSAYEARHIWCLALLVNHGHLLLLDVTPSHHIN